MSWQTYVDSSLLGTGCVVKAAIYGHDGSKWASSEKFEPTTEEVKALLKGVDDPSALQAGGVKFCGEKYMYLRNDPGTSIYFKKGNSGGVFVKTTQAGILGLYDDKISPGQCNYVVEKLGDYLKESGY